MQTVGELGESGVLARILAQLDGAKRATLGPGDDCAVIESRGETVVTTDTMIEGPDFRLAWHTGYELGWKLAATNLSDVAAMGAVPTGLTVALACPKETPVRLLEEISRGLNAACHELAPGVGVVGGDLGQAPVLIAAVTALGDLEGRSAVKRSGAKPGDTVAYAGDLGLAGMGLALLFTQSADEHGVAFSEGADRLRAERPVELFAQLTPTSPIELGVAANIAGATAMMDVSDGLALDAGRMARASRVALDLDESLLADAFGEQRGIAVSLRAMLEGGEDHGLLACFPAGVEMPEGFHAIGTVRELPTADPHPASDNRAEAPAATAPTSPGTLTVNGEPYTPRGWDPYSTLTTLAS